MGSVEKETEAGVLRLRLSQVSPWLCECGEWHRGIWIHRGIGFQKR